MVEFTLVFAHEGGERPVDLASRLSPAPDGRGSLEETFITDPAGGRKFFVLRGSDNLPLCSRDLTAIQPGERRVAWVRFGALPADLRLVTLEIPGIGALSAVPLQDPAAGDGPSGAAAVGTPPKPGP